MNAHITRLLPSTSNLGRTVHLARSARTGPCGSLPRFAVSGRTALGGSLSSCSTYEALLPHEPFFLIVFNSLCAIAIAAPEHWTATGSPSRNDGGYWHGDPSFPLRFRSVSKTGTKNGTRMAGLSQLLTLENYPYQCLGLVIPNSVS